MWFDKELMFIQGKEGESITNLQSGVLGEMIDLGAPNQGAGGRPMFVALLFTKETTATGDPDIVFTLETSETEDFAEIIKIPLSVPSPLKKEDCVEGSCIAAPLPWMGLERYIRLNLDVTGTIACAGLEAGLTPDVNSLRKDGLKKD